MPSQWGFVHLFDLCLWFGHSDTALALALYGVVGCKLEEHHLGALPDASDAPPPRYLCCCTGWGTCNFCCWGFPLGQGVLMQDWDAPLKHAAQAGRKAAMTPLVSGILEIFSRDEELPLSMSDEAAARLLDIAILCGNSQAAGNLAKTFSVRPLRRWRGVEVEVPYALPMLSAALWAGADFQDLLVLESGAVVPLLQFLALDFDSEQWQQLGHFFESTPWWPSRDMQLAGQFFVFLRRLCWISMDRVCNALRSGWDLKYIWNQLWEGDREHAAGLLDLAILCGDSGCADALATAGVELRVGRVSCSEWLRGAESVESCCAEWLQRACRGESLELKYLKYQGAVADWLSLHLGSAFECKSAAFAASRALARRSFKREGVEKGIALLQVMTKFNAADIPLDLVHDILAFSMEAPKILDQLDLWDEFVAFRSMRMLLMSLGFA